MDKSKIKHEVSFSSLFMKWEKKMGFKNDIKWINFLLITFYHIIGVYWCYCYALPAKWQTVLFGK